jgi:hypothetical protein
VTIGATECSSDASTFRLWARGPGWRAAPFGRVGWQDVGGGARDSRGVVDRGHHRHAGASGPFPPRQLGRGRLRANGSGRGRLAQIGGDHVHPGRVDAEHEHVPAIAGRIGAQAGGGLVEVADVGGRFGGDLHQLPGAQMLTGGTNERLTSLSQRPGGHLMHHLPLQREGIQPLRQGQPRVGRVQIRCARRPIGDPVHLHRADGGGHQPAVPGLDPPPYYTVRACDLPEPGFAGGAGVQLVLHQLPLQFAPCLGDVLLQHVLGAGHHLRVTQTGDHLL